MAQTQRLKQQETTSCDPLKTSEAETPDHIQK